MRAQPCPAACPPSLREAALQHSARSAPERSSARTVLIVGQWDDQWASLRQARAGGNRGEGSDPASRPVVTQGSGSKAWLKSGQRRKGAGRPARRVGVFVRIAQAEPRRGVL